MVIKDRKTYYPLQQGFMIMEALVVTCVLISLMSFGSRYITQNAERTVNKITAQQLRQITKAAQNYVQDHHQQFKNNPSETVTWQDLIDSGYLPSQFSDTNNYGQSYGFTIQAENGLLQLVVTTDGGHPISEHSLRQIAAQAGSSAGYASVLHQDKIVDHQESWFLEGIPLKKGHLASLTLVNGKEVMDAAAFLRRTKSDHTEYNQMATDLTFTKDKKIMWNPDGYTDPSEGDPGVSSLSEAGLTLGFGTAESMNEFTGARMRLNRNTLEFDNVFSQMKTVGKLKITSSYIKGSAPTSPSILMESASPNSTPGSINLVADTSPSITLKDNNTWSSEIKPAEIKLESQASGNKSYIANDKLTYHNNSRNSSTLDGYSVVTQDTGYPQAYNLDLNLSRVRSMLTGSGVVIPIFRFMKTEVSPTSFAVWHCQNQATDGSLFIVDSKSLGMSTLFYCCNKWAHQVTPTKSYNE